MYCADLSSAVHGGPKKFNYMRRAIVNGRFIDEKTGCAVDA